MTAEDVFRNHYEARGGIAKFEKVRGIAIQGEMAAGPMSLDMTQAYYVKGPGFMRISAGGNVMQETRFDGNKGSQTAMGQSQPMTQEDLVQAKRDHDVLEFLHLEEYGASAELLGVDKIDGVPHYLIEIREDGKVTESHWFNVETAMRTRTLRGESTPRGDTTIRLDYGPMMEVKDLQFESSVTMNSGGQAMTMNMKEIKLNPKMDEADYSVE